jgi:uncharacterized OsmC-like protein
MRLVRIKAKKLRYAIELTAAGELKEEDGVVLETPPEWTPEHLLLASLVRCSLQSLRHHARGGGVDVRSASGSAQTLVTRRGTDGRYAMVKTTVELAVELKPAPLNVSDLLEFAERDCFVGSSLFDEPRYRWIVNGRTIGS